MRFQVPQFIDVEDKIFGPLTLKQFIYLAGTAGVAFVAFALLPRLLAVIIAAPLVGLGLALAFYRVDNRPFIVLLEAAFNYLTRKRLYLWEKRERPVTPTPLSEATKPVAGLAVPKLSEGKLKDLAWDLTVKESLYADNKEKA